MGGLLALFLGASLITCLELLDVVTRRCCLSLSSSRVHQPNQHRKRCRRKSSSPQHCADANHAHFRSSDDVIADALPLGRAVVDHAHFRPADDVIGELSVRLRGADHAHFRSAADDVVAVDKLAVSNHADAVLLRSALKTPSPLQSTAVAQCGGRLANTSSNTHYHRSAVDSRCTAVGILRPSPLAETDI